MSHVRCTDLVLPTRCSDAGIHIRTELSLSVSRCVVIVIVVTNTHRTDGDTELMGWMWHQPLSPVMTEADKFALRCAMFARFVVATPEDRLRENASEMAQYDCFGVVVHVCRSHTPRVRVLF